MTAKQHVHGTNGTPAAVPSGMAPDDGPQREHVRETTFDGSLWRWVDDRRRILEPPPDIPAITRDKLREHGVPAVMEAFGLSRVATLAIGAGAPALATTMIVASQRLPNLHRLDARADLLAADDLAARARRDAMRDEASDARADKKNGARRT